jgi:hypothetical protein
LGNQRDEEGPPPPAICVREAEGSLFSVCCSVDRKATLYDAD